MDRLQPAAIDVYHRLKNEVESAWQRFDTAANTFQSILKTPDILPPYPDGIQLIRNINREYRVAGEEFLKGRRG